MQRHNSALLADALHAAQRFGYPCKARCRAHCGRRLQPYCKWRRLCCRAACSAAGLHVFILKTLTSSRWHVSADSTASLQDARAVWRPCMLPASQPSVASFDSAIACSSAQR